MLVVTMVGCAGGSVSKWEALESGTCHDTYFAHGRAYKGLACPHPRHVVTTSWADDNKRVFVCTCLR